MHFKDYGVIFNQKGEAIEKVETRSMTIELLASYDGTEVIKHTLEKNARWGIGPNDSWNALEFIFVIDGEINVFLDKERILLKSGDYFKTTPVKKFISCQANRPSQFLYVSSQPVFQNYSNIVQELKQLVIDVEEKDGYTKQHCSRIMKISMKIAEILNLSSQEVYIINLGSFLHDIGKIRIPDQILLKAGKLTDQEWEVIKKHPIYGKEILVNSGNPILKEAAVIVEQHHERYNGSGYPYGLKGDEIHIGAAIVAVVDSFDAMTTDRVYRKALSQEEAIDEIVRNSGKLYHPKVVQAFLSVISGETCKK